jgi:hypothetical protein
MPEELAEAQPDYGPSLPELVRSRFGPLPLWLRLALAVFAALVVVGAAAVVIHHRAQVKTYRQGAADARARGLEPIPFHFERSRRLKISKPPGYYVRGEQRRNGLLVASFSVAPFRIEAQSGLLSGYMPVIATELERRDARAYDDFHLRFEGRARVNDVEGYQYAFRASLPREAAPHRLLFGRVVMLPEPYDIGDLDKDYPAGRQPTRGLRIEMLSTSLDKVSAPSLIGDEGVLKRPYRTFEFGS